jgi:hypothetical protein
MGARLEALLVCFCCAASAAFAAPLRPVSPLDTVATLRGPVEVRSEDQAVLVTVGGLDGDRLFRIETDGQVGPPAAFRSELAQILFWRGHLVVMAPREGKALHFSIPGFEAAPGPTDAPRLGPKSDSLDLDAFLRARYELTEIDATALISRQGPSAFLPGEAGGPRSPRSKMDPIVLPPDPPGPNESCATSCSIACEGGSSCTATCGSGRCADCDCPASCSCRLQ